MKHFTVLIGLLRDRYGFLREIRQALRIEGKITSLLIVSSIFFAIYGAIIGASSGIWMQIIASAVKLPALYLITLVICLPTLYFFDILIGSKLNFNQYVALLLTGVAGISVLLFSFAPVTLFFLISIREYNFFLLLNVAIFTLTGLFGIGLFHQGMRYMHAAPTWMKPDETVDRINDDFAGEQIEIVDDAQKQRNRLLTFWLVLYGLVGSQLGWTLRPFFGSPGQPFQLFRNLEGNFYSQVFKSFLSLMGW
jgi:hypothetical protein